MWARILVILVFLSSVWSQATIEYGGIAFECDERVCAFPEEDDSAKEIVRTYAKETRDVFFETGFLCDNTKRWRNFNPWWNYTDDDSSYIEINRYNWEIEGVIDVRGEYDTLDKVFLPEDDCFSTEKFPINQTGLIQAFNRIRTDLEFYADLRLGYFKRKIEEGNRRIALYRGFQAAGFTHIVINSEGLATDPIRQSDISEDDLADGVYPELFNEIWREQDKVTNFEEKWNKASHMVQISLIWLDRAYAKIDPLLKEIFLWCLKYHQPEGIAFNGAVESLLVGDLPEALEYIRTLLEIGEKTDFSPELMSKIHLLKGQLQSEFCLHGEAIVSLTEAIHKNPSSQEAYLERAASYFELGEFELAIEDYVMQEMLSHPSICDNSDFAKGFVLGAAGGFGEAVCSFIPSTLSSLQGIGHFLWTTLQHPIDTPRAVILSALEIFSIIRQCSPSELATLAVPELKSLIDEWDRNSDFTRGQQIGHILGKYGTEMLTPLALRKGTAFVMHIHDLKKADKLATLKSLSDIEKKGGILEGSSRAVQNRQGQLAKIKIEWDKQNKHVPEARNFDPEKSHFTHGNAQDLLDQFAGKGRKMRGELGSAGYREKINFEVVIGKVENDRGQFIETTWGSIEYSKNGAHIVPRLPDASQ